MQRLADSVRRTAWRLERLGARLEGVGPPQAADFYDGVFDEHPEYAKHYSESVYHGLWAIIADRLKPLEALSVVELGCGPGQLARLLRDAGLRRYVGHDLSRVAITAARARVPDLDFAVTDLTTDLPDYHGVDAVIATEVLEHIDQDRELLESLPSGVRILASVPNFPATGHLRTFATSRSVERRYGGLFAAGSLRVTAQQINARGAIIYLLDGRRI